MANNALRDMLGATLPPLRTVPPEVRTALKIPPKHDVTPMNLITFAPCEMDEQVAPGKPQTRRRKVIIVATYNTLYVCDPKKGTAITVLPHSEVGKLTLFSNGKKGAASPKAPPISGEGFTVAANPAAFAEHKGSKDSALLIQTADGASFLSLHFSAKSTAALSGAASAAELLTTVKTIHDATHSILFESADLAGDVGQYTSSFFSAGGPAQLVGQQGGGGGAAASGDAPRTAAVLARFIGDPAKAMAVLTFPLLRKPGGGAPPTGDAVRAKITASASVINTAAKTVAASGGIGAAARARAASPDASQAGASGDGGAGGSGIGSGDDASFCGSLQLRPDRGDGGAAADVDGYGDASATMGIDGEFPLDSPRSAAGDAFADATARSPSAGSRSGNGGEAQQRRGPSASAVDADGAEEGGGPSLPLPTDPNALYQQMMEQRRAEEAARLAAESAPLAAPSLPQEGSAEGADAKKEGGAYFASEVTADFFTNSVLAAAAAANADGGEDVSDDDDGDGSEEVAQRKANARRLEGLLASASVNNNPTGASGNGAAAVDPAAASLAAFYKQQKADDKRKKARDAKRAAKAAAAIAAALAKCEAEEERRRRRIMKRRVRGVNRRYERMDMLLHGEVADFAEAVAGMAEEEAAEDAAEEAAEAAVAAEADRTLQQPEGEGEGGGDAEGDDEKPIIVVDFTAPLDPLRTAIIPEGRDAVPQYSADVLGPIATSNGADIEGDLEALGLVGRKHTNGSNGRSPSGPSAAAVQRGASAASASRLSRQPSRRADSASQRAAALFGDDGGDDGHIVAPAHSSPQRSPSRAGYSASSPIDGLVRADSTSTLLQAGSATPARDVLRAYGLSQRTAEESPFDPYAAAGSSSPIGMAASDEVGILGANGLSMPSRVQQAARNRRDTTVDPAFYTYGAAPAQHQQQHQQLPAVAAPPPPPPSAPAPTAVLTTPLPPPPPQQTVPSEGAVSRRHSAAVTMGVSVPALGFGQFADRSGVSATHVATAATNATSGVGIVNSPALADAYDARGYANNGMRRTSGDGDDDPYGAAAILRAERDEAIRRLGLVEAQLAAERRHQQQKQQEDAEAAAAAMRRQQQTEAEALSRSHHHSGASPSSFAYAPSMLHAAEERLGEQRRLTALLSNRCAEAAEALEASRAASDGRLRGHLLEQQRRYEGLLADHHRALAEARGEAQRLSTEVAAMRRAQQQQQQQHFASPLRGHHQQQQQQQYTPQHLERAQQQSVFGGGGERGAYDRLASMYTPYASYAGSAAAGASAAPNPFLARLGAIMNAAPPPPAGEPRAALGASFQHVTHRDPYQQQHMPMPRGAAAGAERRREMLADL